jgi:hypothetical protein
MAQDQNMGGKTVRKILIEYVGIRKVPASVVPHVLSDDQRQQ